MHFDHKYQPELCASKDETRPHICHVEYDMEAKRLVATDGHRMVVIPCTPEDGEASGIITADALKAARKVDKKRHAARVHANGALVTGQASDGPTFVRPSRDTAFPPWKQVMPKWKHGTEGTLTIGVNARYIADAAKALGADNVWLTVKLPEPGKAMLDPILVTTGESEDSDASCVVMPVRV